MRIAVLGAGTYGSYVINSLIEKHPNAEITLFDVGDKHVKSEKEIGFFSSLKKSMYKGLTDGRYFGFGGASDKWGGQLLTEKRTVNTAWLTKESLSSKKE